MLLLSVLGIVALGLQMPKLKTILAIEDLIDESFVSKEGLDVLKNDFQVANSIVFVAEPPKGAFFDGAFLCDLKKWLSSERLSNPDILSSVSGFDIRTSNYTGDRLLFPVLLDVNCESDLAEGEIRKAFGEISESPWGLYLTGRPARHFTIELALKDAPSDNKYGSFDPTIVRKIRDGFHAEVGSRHPAYAFHWIGPSDYQYYMYKGLDRVSYLNVFMVLFLIVLMRIFFGTWRSGLILTFTLVVTGVVVYGTMAVFKVPVDLLSKSLFLMIAVSGLEDFVFISQHRLERTSNWRKPFRVILIAGFLTSLTTFVGFGSLGVSDLAIIQRFSVWSAYGSMIECGMVFLFLPMLMKHWKWLRDWADPRRAWFLNSLNADSGFAVPKAVSWASFAVYGVALWSVYHLQVTDAPLEMFPAGHDFRKGVEFVNQEYGWESGVSLIFPDIKNERVNREATEKISKLPLAAGVLSAYDSIDYLTKDYPKITQEMIRRHAENSGFLRSLISDEGPGRAIVLIKSTELSRVEEFKAEASKICAPSGCYLAGGIIPYSEFSQKIPKTLLESLLLSMFLVSLIIGWITVSVGQHQIARVILCTFWGPMLMLTVTTYLKVNVNFLTCIFATVLVGVTGDNAIQYLVASRKRELEEGVNRRARASIATSLIMALASLVFLGSYFVPPRTFGLLLVGGFIASLVGDLWLLKGLIAEPEPLRVSSGLKGESAYGES